MIQRQLSEGLEMLQCAQANLENLVNQVPMLRVHPFYKIVEMQLIQAERILSGESEQLTFQEHVEKIEGQNDARKN